MVNANETTAVGGKLPLLTRIGNKFFGKDSTHEVPNRELVRYMAGIMGQNWTFGLVSGWFLFFCTDVMYFNPLIIGSILAASRVWDAVNDPIVGSLVDMHIFKNGEKLRPFLKIMAIPIGITVVLLFVDFGLTEKMYMYYVIAVYFMFDLFYSFQDVAQWGMTSLVATTSAERSKVAQFARIAASIGGWIPGLITIALDYIEVINLSPKTFFLMLAIGVGFGGMVISMFGHSAKERVPVKKITGNPFKSLGMVFKNKIVVLCVLGSILSSCTLTVQQVYFFKYMISVNLFGVQINGLTMNFIFGLLVGLPGMCAMFFTVWFSKRVKGMKNIIVIATVSNVVVRLAAFLIGYEGINLLFTGILLALSGIPNGMIGIAKTSLWGDSLDYMEWKTGERNEGAVFSMENFTAKITGAISTFFTGLTLTILQFDATLYKLDLPQSPVFNKWVWPIFILAPALGSFFFMIPLLFIKYNNKQKEILESKLKYTRAVRAGLITPHDEIFKDYNKVSGRTDVDSADMFFLARAKFPKKDDGQDDIIW